MRILNFIVLSVFMLGGITLYAQNRNISGKILDAQEQPLIGAAVVIDGTTKEP